MKRWRTIVYAIDPKTNELTTFDGPIIEAISWTLAEEYCQMNGLGYCYITSEVIGVEPQKKGTSKTIDYETINLN